MRIVLLLIIALLPLQVVGQNFRSDSELLKRKCLTVKSFGVENKRSFRPMSLLYAGTLGFYQTQISPQWGANCAFEITCSHFSKKLVQEYGLAKGFFLSFDRIGRCSKISFFETSPIRINSYGKIIDDVEFYKLH